MVGPALPELEPGADDEMDGAASSFGMNGRGAGPSQEMVIPPREHSERERLAMRPEIRGELGPLIDDLHSLFEREIASAKQPASARCGICYLHFPIATMEYRESDGFYICQACDQAMRGKPLRMIRRQPRTGG
jgi:hypothetical protein